MLKFTNKIKLTAAWLSLLFIAGTIKIQAQTNLHLGNINCIGNFCPDGKPQNTLENFFTTLLRFFTILAGLMFIIYFILGALTWLTSEGDKEKLKKAQGQITNGLVGLVIIVAAYSIIYLVGKILGLNIFTPATEINNMIQK